MNILHNFVQFWNISQALFPWSKYTTDGIRKSSNLRDVIYEFSVKGTWCKLFQKFKYEKIKMSGVTFH